jgi:hypothetical protein
MVVLDLIATGVDEVTTPAAGNKQGARLIFTEDLREPGTNKPVIGQHSGDCVLVREPDAGSGPWWFCRAGWKLPNGYLVAGGLLDFGPNAPSTFKVAIFGGTGAYKDARGEITGTPGQNQTTYHLEIGP